MGNSFNSNRQRYRGGRPSGNRSRSSNFRGRSNRGNRGPTKSTIHPSKFIKPATASTQEDYVAKHQFDDFLVGEVLKANLIAKGYKTPSPIQDAAIPVGLAGGDVIGIASTGTGKTAAFAVPVLHKLIENSGSSAIVVAPTRELAQQIKQEFESLANNIDLKTVLLIGGSNMGRQLRTLQSKPRLVIGTPGRMKDHIKRGSLDLKNCDTVILDEVDRMLDMGFVNDMEFILACTSQQKQSMFFSATLDNRVKDIISKFSTEPTTIMIQASSSSDNVHQDIISYSGNSDRLEKLHDLLIKQQVNKAIVFNETKRSVEDLSKQLKTRGFKADALHGGKSQGQRQRALRKLKEGEITILVATDVAARGIDVADVTHVINYSIPREYQDYIHRIGRTGRAGATGYAFTFVDQR